MNRFLDQLLRLKAPVKVAITIAAMGAVTGLYYFLFFTELSQQIDGALNRQRALKTEKQQYEQRKKEYLAYRNELQQLQEEQRDLLKALPRNAEIPSFLSQIQEQAELSGIEIVTLGRQAEIPEDLYIKIPVQLEVRGPYHSVTKFFKNIGDMRRIVNVEDLSLQVEAQAGAAAAEGAPRLRAKFTAATFRYQERALGTTGGV